MPLITADTANGTVSFEAEEGRKLVLAIEDNNIDILHRCGGNARCTTCRVEVLSGDPGPIGVEVAVRLDHSSDVLACMRAQQLFIRSRRGFDPRPARMSLL